MGNKLRPREFYEDYFHDLICLMLPKFKRSDIRPTYQKNGGRAVTNVIEDGKVVAVNGFTNGSNVIYYTVIFEDNIDLDSYTHLDGNVDITRAVNLKIYIYGNQSQEIALILKSLFRHNQIMMDFESKGFALLKTGSIMQLNEIINGEVWERRDLTITFNENIDIPVPSLNKVVILNNDSVKVEVNK